MDNIILIVIAVLIYFYYNSNSTESFTTRVMKSLVTDTRAKMTSNAPFVSSNHTTNWNDEDGGNMIYLDRHDVNCPKGAALSRVHLARDGRGKYRYEYSCTSGQNFGNPVPSRTDANDWGGGNTIFLDRHNSECKPGQAMSRYHLSRPAGNKVQYEYNCTSVPDLVKCSDRNTPWNDEGRGNAIYLDRHDISCPADNLISKMHLVRDGRGKYRYDYRCCARQ